MLPDSIGQLQALEKHGVQGEYEREARQDMALGEDLFLPESEQSDLAWLREN